MASIKNNLKKVNEWNKLPDYPIYIQWNGYFDMQDLYQSMIDFMMHQKFKYQQKLHFHKNAGPFGFEEKHKMVFWKKAEDYYQYNVDIYLHIFDLQDIEVKTPEGEKKKYNKGRIWIEIRGHTDLDYEGRFDKNRFLAQLKSFYHKYVIQKKAEAIWWDELHYKTTNKLRNFIQQRLRKESEEFEARYFAGVH